MVMASPSSSHSLDKQPDPQSDPLPDPHIDHRNQTHDKSPGVIRIEAICRLSDSSHSYDPLRKYLYSGLCVRLGRCAARRLSNLRHRKLR
jgi:hypothetical protein